MSHAETCPVCSNTGKVKKWNQFEIKKTACNEEFVVCHGCHGRGWITVGTEYLKSPYASLYESIEMARADMRKGAPYLSHSDIFDDKGDYSPLLDKDMTEEF